MRSSMPVSGPMCAVGGVDAQRVTADEARLVGEQEQHRGAHVLWLDPSVPHRGGVLLRLKVVVTARIGFVGHRLLPARRIVHHWRIRRPRENDVDRYPGGAASKAAAFARPMSPHLEAT